MEVEMNALIVGQLHLSAVPLQDLFAGKLAKSAKNLLNFGKRQIK